MKYDVRCALSLFDAKLLELSSQAVYVLLAILKRGMGFTGPAYARLVQGLLKRRDVA